MVIGGHSVVIRWSLVVVIQLSFVVIGGHSVVICGHSIVIGGGLVGMDDVIL